MAFFIHKRLWNFSYVRHNRLTIYALHCTISNFSATHFDDCVSKLMVVSLKAHFSIVASASCRFITYSPKRHFLLNKQKIYRSYYVDFKRVFDVFHRRWSNSTWPKPNHDLWHLDPLDVGGDKIVTSLLDTRFHTDAHIRMVYFIPCTYWKSYYQHIFGIKFWTELLQHVLVVLNFLCTVIYKNKTDERKRLL